MTSAVDERIAVFDSLLDAVEREDRDAIERLAEENVHEDCEWTPLIGAAIEGSYHGPSGFVRFYADLLESFSVRYRDRDWRTIGDETLALLCMMEFRGRGSDAPADQPLGAVLELEDGLLRRGRAYGGHAEALAAAEAPGA